MNYPTNLPPHLQDTITELVATLDQLRTHGALAWQRAHDHTWHPHHGTPDGPRTPGHADPTATTAIHGTHSHTIDQARAYRDRLTHVTNACRNLRNATTQHTRTQDHTTTVPCTNPQCDDTIVTTEDRIRHTDPLCDRCDRHHRRTGQLPTRERLDQLRTDAERKAIARRTARGIT